jgi:hypothetical protein
MNAGQVACIGGVDGESAAIRQPVLREAKRNAFVEADNLLNVIQQPNQLLAISLGQTALPPPPPVHHSANPAFTQPLPAPERPCHVRSRPQDFGG